MNNVNDNSGVGEEVVSTTKIPQYYTLSILCALFGFGAWLPVNAVYSQIPVLTNTAPEGWTLASYFALIVQLANVAPLAYYCLRKKCAAGRQSYLICVFLIIGVLSMFVMAYTYNVTSTISDRPYSLYFFVFSFVLAMLGCVSSVLFIPFMYKLPELYLVPFFIGESMAGLVPGLVAAIQGVGREICSNGSTLYVEPRFSTRHFLLAMGFALILSTLSFIYLNYCWNFVEPVVVESETSRYKDYRTQEVSREERNGSAEPVSVTFFGILLAVQTVTNAFSNGILPSIQSYSCRPYGADAYHWSVLLNQISTPAVMYVVGFFLPLLSVRLLALSVAVLVVCIAYEMMTALSSPYPPIMGTAIGTIIIVSVWMTGSGLIAYIKLSIASIFRRHSKEGLINYGLVTQAGSAAGAALSFVMVNYLKLFEGVVQNTCV